MKRTRDRRESRLFARPLGSMPAATATTRQHGTMISTPDLSPLGSKISLGGSQLSPRIALLDCYHGSNLGDASIQDSMVANLGIRLPNTEIYGITLNSKNFVDQHGVGAFPLAARYIRWYGMSYGRYAEQPKEQESHGRVVAWGREIKSALKRVPILNRCLPVLAIIPQEILHVVGGYRFLRTKDLLVVSGGGQLNEEWGGAWGQPFALFKWAVLARIARVPYAVASVGTGKVTSGISRLFVASTLRMACYRSYRDKNTREIATGLMQGAAADPVAPDLAFSLPSSELPLPASIRRIAQGRAVVAISPISYAKPGRWYFEDRALYERYVHEMAQAVSLLLRRGCFLVIVCSSLGDDETVIPELLGRVDDESKQRLAAQVYIPSIRTWRHLVAILRDADLLIASRLHSTIFGFMSETPVIAISCERKVDWLMEDVGQTDYLLQFRDFTSQDVIGALNRLEQLKDIVLQQVASYRHQILPVAARQYDILADLAMSSCRRRERGRVIRRKLALWASASDRR
jgi:polysaccharide pyruvyl transferase WcaK-like protein